MSYESPKYLSLRSNMRHIYYNSAGDFIIYLNSPIKITKLKLLFACIPNSFTEIKSPFNTLYVDGSQYSVPEGNYTLNNLLTALDTATSLTWTYDSLSNTISHSGTNTGNSNALKDDYSLLTLLGFNESLVSSNTSIYGPRIVKHTIFLDFDIPQTKGCYIVNSTAFTHSTFCLVNHSSIGEYLDYDVNRSYPQEYCLTYDYITNKIHIKIHDRDQLLNVSDWDICLEIN